MQARWKAALRCGITVSAVWALTACGGGGTTTTTGSSDAASYTIGVTVSGLSSGTLQLQNNAADTLSITANGAASFSTALASGANYAVTVLAQPAGQTCLVTSGSGTVGTSNVSGIAVACAASWSGTRQLGVAGQQVIGNAVAVDPSGNVVIAGYTDGGLDSNTRIGNQDFFVTQYSRSGVKQFTRQLGATGTTTTGWAAATDASGNIFVVGDTQGSLDGNTLAGTNDLFVTKYDSGGNKLFTRQLGSSFATVQALAVAVDASGNVFLAGITNAALDGQTKTGSHDLFLTKYSNSGVKQFTRLLGVAGQRTSGNGVAVDASGNVYVVGETFGGLDGNTLRGTKDFFLTKYSSSGVKQFTRQLGVSGVFDTVATSVATDTNGNVFVAGYTTGGLDGNTLAGTQDFFLTKYDSTGARLFTRQLGVAGLEAFANGVTVDSNGNVNVVGVTDGALDGAVLTGFRDVFMTQYSNDGVKQFTRMLGVSGDYTLGRAVAANPGGGVFVAGYTYAGLDGNTVTGSPDFFITKYSSTGVKQ